MNKSAYLILILIWALPPLILQWLLGADLILKRWKLVVGGVLIPLLYEAILVAVAFQAQLWIVNPAQVSGMLIPILNMPIEQGLLLLVINLLTVQGLFLIADLPVVLNRIGRVIRLIRRGPNRAE